MKWKAVTRRTRILGMLAMLAAAAVVWSSVKVYRNPCAALTRLESEGGRLLAAAWEPGSGHLLRVQDDDGDADTTNNGVGAVEYPPMVREQAPQAAPCAVTHERDLMYRGISLSAFLVLTLGTLYSYYRDRRRYAKRLRGRARRDERRRRRAEGLAQSTAVPMKSRDGLAELCACGCGEGTFPGEDFVPGHAQMLRLELEEKAGGLLALRDLVELHARPGDPADQ